MRVHQRLAAVIGLAAIASLSVAPAVAAAPVAQSGANAAHVSVAGNGQGTGTVTATHDGSRETRAGDATPPISLLKQQDLLNAGVLAQEATARGNSTAAACAGVTGEGGSVAQVGDSACLRPGRPIDLSVTNLDFSRLLVVDPQSALGPLAQANAPLQMILTQISDPLREGIQDTPLGTTALGGTLGAIEGRCTAGPDSASGTANIVDSQLTLTIADQELVLADLPAHPAPNTVVPVQLDKATAVILGAVEQQLTSMLAAPGTTGPLAPAAALPEALQDQVITALVDATREQLLQPLQDNVLELVLNRQNRTGADHIKVGAFDLQLLPAAREQLDASLARVQLGNVACGPNRRPAPQAAPAPRPQALPTAVSAGYGDSSAAPETGPAEVSGDDHSMTATVVGSLALLTTAGMALLAWRRLH
jgi:hypothetical protein